MLFIFLNGVTMPHSVYLLSHYYLPLKPVAFGFAAAVLIPLEYVGWKRNLAAKKTAEKKNRKMLLCLLLIVFL